MSPDSLFWFGLLFKMVLTASIVVSASVAVERSGPLIGALIASLPTSAGAAYIILAIEHDAAFLATSAVGSLAANAATAVFAAVFAMLAQTRGPVVSAGGAIAVWLVCAAAIRSVEWTIVTAMLLAAATYAATIAATARFRTAEQTKPAMPRGRYDLATRTVIVVVFVAVVTTLSNRIGAFASGLFAVFPVAMSSFAVILQLRLGGPAAARVLAHAQVPLVGFSLGFVVLHFAAESIGTWWVLAAHLATCIAWNAMLWMMRTKAR